MLRALVYLKRISKALDRIAAAQENMSVPVEHGRRLKLAEVFTPSTDQINDIYDEEAAER
jgi:hypothetical protein